MKKWLCHLKNREKGAIMLRNYYSSVLGKDIEDEKKQLIINDGDWAGKVSKELEDMGIIDDAVSFDKYLSDNGYSNVIKSGTYDVSPDDTYPDLAKKITSHSR